MSESPFTVWVTGPIPDGLDAVVDGLIARLGAREVPAETLDRRTPGIDALAGDGMVERITFVAGLLARRGIATVVGLGATRAARDGARATLGRMIEVYVHPEGTTAPAPDFEAPERPEVDISLPEPSPGSGVDRVLHTLEVLRHLPRASDPAYSAEEEREVIRRLKAFGYL